MDAPRPPKEEEVFTYDVAFSFLNSDLRLAQLLANSLSQSLRVFIYTAEQRRIAATDGVETFASVFKREARLVVLIYRAGYGAERWTRMEESAIRERNYHHGGWPFLVFVTVEEKPFKPPWLPDTFVRFDHAAFGTNELLGVIRHRVQELGAELRIETPRERAARLRRESEQETEHAEILSGPRGLLLARDELERLRARMEEEALSIAKDWPALELSTVKGGDPTKFDWTLRSPAASVHLYWTEPSRQRLRNASLNVIEIEGLAIPGAQGGRRPPSSEPQELQFALDGHGVPAWKTPWKRELLTTDALADYLLTRLINRMHGKPPDDESGPPLLVV